MKRQIILAAVMGVAALGLGASTESAQAAPASVAAKLPQAGPEWNGAFDAQHNRWYLTPGGMQIALDYLGTHQQDFPPSEGASHGVIISAQGECFGTSAPKDLRITYLMLTRQGVVGITTDTAAGRLNLRLLQRVRVTSGAVDPRGNYSPSEGEPEVKIEGFAFAG